MAMRSAQASQLLRLCEERFAWRTYRRGARIAQSSTRLTHRGPRCRWVVSIRAGVLLGWSVGVVAVSLFLPAYNGAIGNEGVTLTAIWAASVCFAVLAWMGGANAQSSSQALLSALIIALPPALVAVVGLARAESAVSGEPLYLWFGLAVAASWIWLTLVSSSWDRLRWTTPSGAVVCLWTCLVVWFLTSARFN